MNLPKQTSVHNFRTSVEGHYLLYNGTEGLNEYGAQCVNTNGEFLELCGLAQLPGNADTLDYSSYGRWIPNLPTNFPKAGDFPVFLGGNYDAVNGHIGLALHDSDEMKLHILWQNLPDGSPEQAVWVSYASCTGWWRIDWTKHGVELTY